MRRILLSLSLLMGCSQLPGPQEESAGRALVLAAYRGDVDEMRRLLDRGTPANARFGAGGEEVLQLSGGSYAVGASQWTPLIAASSLAGVDPARHDAAIQAVRLLLAKGANPSLDDGLGSTALHYALTADRGAGGAAHTVALELLAAGATVSSRAGVYVDGPARQTPTHLAVHDAEVLQAILKRGAAIDATDSWGRTPLHLAVIGRHPRSVSILIDSGGNPNARDRDGRTPLYFVGIGRLRGNVGTRPEIDPREADEIVKKLAAERPKVELEIARALQDVGGHE
jgi:ankyrin repeat protein